MARTPAQIGKYKIVSLLAEGGMGAVYKAQHPTLNRFVVLKKLALRGSSSFAERFLREARIMMDFKTEHIVNVYDHFKEKSFYYIVEEYIEGLSLDKLIRRERYLPNDVALLIFRDCCRALKYAHEQGVVHRDIKPGNILIGRSGQVKLSDFGIATSHEEEEAGLTREGMTLGTVSYMPPEQIRNSRGVDRRADIYALGAMLYEMVTGKPPFPGNFSPETIMLIQRGRYRPVQRVNPRVSPLVRRLIRRAMRTRPGRRFQNVGEILRLLDRYFLRKDPAAVDNALRRVMAREELGRLPARRLSPLRTAFTVLGVLLVLVGAAYYLLLERGYLYEFLMADRYGALTVRALVEQGVRGGAAPSIRARLFARQGSEFVPLEEPSFRFRETQAGATEQLEAFQSRRVYLRSGSYRLLVSLENRLYLQVFHLDPRTLQRRSVGTFAGRRIDVRLPQAAPRPLTLRYTVRNGADGTDITAGTAFSIQRGGRWLRREQFGRLLSGRSYRFRLQHPHYYSREMEVAVDTYQSELVLEAELVPVEGTLSIEAEVEGLRLLLNGSPYYLPGGQNTEVRRLAPTRRGTRSLALAPGKYQLTVERGSDVRGLAVEVPSGGEVTVRVGQVEGGRLLLERVR